MTEQRLHYEKNEKKTYIEQIRMLAASFKKQVAPLFPSRECDGIMESAWNDFMELFPELPYIGGEKNPLTKNLLGAAYEMGLYSLLEDKGISLVEISAMNQKALIEYTKKEITPERLEFMKSSIMTEKNYSKGAALSQEKRFDGDWVYEYVKPDRNDDFDIGITYSECGIVKLYKKYGKERYLPYLCANDFPVLGTMGICLTRTMTIGNGASCCDFRMKLHADAIPFLECNPESLPEFGRNDIETGNEQ